MNLLGEGLQQFALATQYLATQQVESLDTVGTFVDRRDTAVTNLLLLTPFTDKAVTTEHLLTQQRGFQTGIGHKGFTDRRQEGQLGFSISAGFFFSRVVRLIQQLGCVVGQCTVTFVEGFHGQQHATHVRVNDDRVSRFFRCSRAFQRTHLQTIFGVSQRALVGRFTVTQTLHAGTQASMVHHGEHAVQALVDITDQKAGGIVKVHHAGRGSLDTHLVLDGATDQAVALAYFTVRIRQELGHDEQGDTLGASRRVGQLGQYQVNDVFRHVVLTARDEDLGAGHLVGTVSLRHSAGFNQTQVGTTVRLGQAHGAGPSAGGQLVQVQLFLLVGAVRSDRRSTTVGQTRVHAERVVGGGNHLGDDQAQGRRQALSTVLGRGGHGAPAVFAVGLIGFLEALRRGDDAVFDVAAFFVTGAVQRRQHLVGELGTLFQDRADQIRRGVFQTVRSVAAGHVQQLVHDKAHVAQGGVIFRHVDSPKGGQSPPAA